MEGKQILLSPEKRRGKWGCGRVAADEARRPDFVGGRGMPPVTLFSLHDCRDISWCAPLTATCPGGFLSGLCTSTHDDRSNGVVCEKFLGQCPDRGKGSTLEASANIVPEPAVGHVTFPISTEGGGSRPGLPPAHPGKALSAAPSSDLEADNA